MRLISVGLFVVLTLAVHLNVHAQAAQSITINALEFKGLQEVNEQLVSAQVEIQPGQTFSLKAILRLAVARDLRRLYELDFFTTIQADLDPTTGVLTYIFEEKRLIDAIRIVGNKKIKERPIRGVLTWREGDSFVKEGYDEERDALIDLYRAKGFLSASVDIVVEETRTSRVRITYIIDEGKKAKIRKIHWEGNQALTDKQLKKATKTRRAYWFFGGKYDDEKFEADLHKVIEAYGDVGHLESEIASTDFQYAKNRKRLSISIFINEGPQYNVGSIDFTNNFVFGDQELVSNIEINVDDIHNKTQVEEDAAEIQDRYRESGYVNAQVFPRVTLDRETKTTTIVHQMLPEGDLKYIREIDITGNSITKDEVIRRHILLEPGERFDGKLRRASLNRLGQTRYFEGVRMPIEDDPENNRFTNLLLDVDEGKTGNFNFGGAFNSDEGVAGFGELQLNNFDITNWPSLSGGGQQFSARFSLGQVRTNYRISFTDPEIGGYPLSFGFDVFSERFRPRGGTDFTTETVGGQLRLAKRLSSFVMTRAAINYSDVEITGLDEFVDPALRELEDAGSTLALSFGLNRNTTNDFRDPTAGASHDISTKFGGFGLDNEFLKFNHDSTFYFAPKRSKKIAFSIRTREGVAFPTGDREFVPIQERYFAGGSNTIRGYDFRDVGPRAQTFRIVNGQVVFDDESIGGHFRVLETVETKYILNDLIRLYVFADGGGVWLDPEDFDFADFRYSAGIGIGLNIPVLGPLRIDYGYPLNPDEDQGSGRIHLQSSLNF